MTASILATDRITMEFGGLRAVSALNLEVAPGEIIGIIGPNGAGKTTVFNMITGVYKPTSGYIFFKGDNITGLKYNCLYFQYLLNFQGFHNKLKHLN